MSDAATAASAFWVANSRSKRDAVLPMFSRIATNIVSNPNEPKYKSIKVSPPLCAPSLVVFNAVFSSAFNAVFSSFVFLSPQQSFFLSKTEGISLAGELMLALGFQIVDDLWIFLEHDTAALQTFIATIADLHAADQAQLEEQRAKIARDQQSAALAIDREKHAKLAAARAKEDIAKKERAQQQSLCPAQASIAAPMAFGTRGEVVVKAKGG